MDIVVNVVFISLILVAMLYAYKIGKEDGIEIGIDEGIDMAIEEFEKVAKESKEA